MPGAVIVQARLKSTRLPGKVLLPLPSYCTVLETVLARCHSIQSLEHVVAAISDDQDSDILAQHIGHITNYDKGFTHIVRGPEHDVLQRYILAAEAVGADTIMRVTSDCPLIDPRVCETVLQAYQSYSYDYVSNTMPQTWPVGLDCEVFSLELLKRAAQADEAQYPGNKEHVTVWMQNASEVKRYNVEKPGARQSHIRWTLDTIEDYAVIYREFEQRHTAGRPLLCA